MTQKSSPKSIMWCCQRFRTSVKLVWYPILGSIVWFLISGHDRKSLTDFSNIIILIPHQMGHALTEFNASDGYLVTHSTDCGYLFKDFPEN